MASWSAADLRTLASSDELLVAPLRADGVTYRAPTPVWFAIVDGALYVRSARGPAALWYKAARAQQAGRIVSGSATFEVTFAPVAGPINSAIDAAYLKRYERSPYLSSVVGVDSYAVTIAIAPLSVAG